MTAHVRHSCVTAVVLLVLGCATERGTGPQESHKLSPVPLSEVLVVDTSSVILPSDTVFTPPNQRVFTFRFPSDVLQRRDDWNDFQIRFWRPSTCPTDAEFKNSSTGIWERLEEKPIYATCGASFTETYWLVKAAAVLPDSPVDAVIDSMILRGSLYYPIIRAIQYTPQYEYVSVVSNWPATTSSKDLAWDGENLWVSVPFYVIGDSITIGDSLHAYTTSGVRLHSTVVPDMRFYAIESGGGNLWGLGDEQIVRLNREGERTGEFGLPEDMNIGPLAWRDDALWIVPNGGELLKFDIGASLSEGMAVVEKRVSLEDPSPYQVRATWVDTLLFVQHNSRQVLVVYNPSGKVVTEYKLPVRTDTGLEWDGESLWMLHRGANGAHTRATLLSRFTLP